ncbi:MAG: ATP-binding protein, partial [bacterium]
GEAAPHFLDVVFQEAVRGGGPAAGIDHCYPQGVCVQAVAPVRSGGETAGYVRAATRIDDGFAGRFSALTGAEFLLLRNSRLAAGSIAAGAVSLREIDRVSRGLALLEPGAVSADRQAAEAPPPSFNVKAGEESYVFRALPMRSAGGEVLAWKLIGRASTGIVRAWRRALWTMLFITLCILPAGILVGAGTARRLTRPLRVLLEGVRRITGGDLDAAIGLSRRDEIGGIADAFNEMTRALRDRENRLREAAVELRRNQEQIIRSGKLSAIGELAAGVAHEIGNPVSAISGYAQLLRKKTAGDPRAGEYLAEIEKEADFIARIIQDLLDFSRPAPPGVESVDVHDAVETALRTASALPAFDRVEVVKEYDSVPAVTGRPEELAQVFLNLVLNAAQAMPGGGRLVVRTGRSAAGGVEITFEDEGGGIAPEIRERIFEPFFTTKPPGEGTGLGLSISYRIVEKYGGRIEVESEPGRGSVFRVALPVRY